MIRFRRWLMYLLLVVITSSCGTTLADKEEVQPETAKIDSPPPLQTPSDENYSVAEEDTTNYDYAIYYVVVADTSPDYYLLHKKMFDLHKQLNIPIDTMRRYYNKTKNLIVLPDDDEDDLYAGDYYPRRFPSANLSLEYLSLYQKQSGEHTIVLVAGIYQHETSADSALAILQKSEEKAFKVKTDMYIGCIH